MGLAKSTVQPLSDFPRTLCSSLIEPSAVFMNNFGTSFVFSFLFHMVNSSGPFRSHLRSSFVIKALSDPLCLMNDLGALYVDSIIPGIYPLIDFIHTLLHDELLEERDHFPIS